MKQLQKPDEMDDEWTADDSEMLCEEMKVAFLDIGKYKADKESILFQFDGQPRKPITDRMWEYNFRFEWQGDGGIKFVREDM